MDAAVLESTLLRVRQLIEADDIGAAIKLIEGLYPADQADLFEELELDQQQTLLPALDIEDAADILEDMEDPEAAELAAMIDADALAHIVDEMAPDKAADLLGDLAPSLTTATLEHMEDSEEVRPLLLHPDETAGGLMTSEYLAFPGAMRADAVLAAIRDWHTKGIESTHYFVVDPAQRLLGIVSLLDLVRADGNERIDVLMDSHVLTVNVGDDQEAAARLMTRYDLYAVPVVDDRDHVVGVITVDDLVDVMEDEATEDIHRISGVEPLRRPYLDAGILSLVWRRIGWLLLLFVTGTLTGSVMRLFQNSLPNMVTLTVFVPLLIGTGGNAGSQSTATIIRALAVGDVDYWDAGRVLWRELRTAILLGVLLATIAYFRSLAWGNSPAISAVVASSILGIVIWADCVGALLPIVASRLKIDPALISGPLMSTLVDATGLLIYFTIASAVL